jgi:hypothetical protein
VNTSLIASAPVASIGNGVRIGASGAKTSSIVLASAWASPLLVASWKRLIVALLASYSPDISLTPRRRRQSTVAVIMVCAP